MLTDCTGAAFATSFGEDWVDVAAAPAAMLRLLPPPDDFEYVPPDDRPDEDLKCGVCLSWPSDPVVLGCPGGHMFCRRCLVGGLCPLDRQPFARAGTPQRPILSLLGRLQVRCPDAGAGCSWTGPRATVEDHRSTCFFAQHACECCGARLRRCDQGFSSHTHAEAGAPFAQQVAVPSPRGVAKAPGTVRRLEDISRVISAYEHAERLNVCFLVDCTGSMGGHINAVKRQIAWIVHEMRARLPSMQLHLAFVGYRDHCDRRRVEVLPFTNSVTEFRDFVASMRATGGGADGPEDVHGGLEEVCKLDWNVNGAATRVLIHIGDYPAHGRRYNDIHSDSFPNGDPRGLDLESMVRTLKEDFFVQYTFGHITHHTEKMVSVLSETFPNYIASRNMMDVALVAEVVTASLHSSVASTVSTLTSMAAADPLPSVVLDGATPDWQNISADLVSLHGCHRVTDVGSLFADADPSLTRCFQLSVALVSMAPLPFAQGETRVARHALYEDGRAAVAKHFKMDHGDDDDDDGSVIGSSPRPSHLTLSEVSAVAAFLAEVFSTNRAPDERVRFLSSAAGCGPGLVPFNLEDALPVGEFKRFSNNVGWWEPGAPRTLMEFTRFTHQATRAHMMVVDLQGVKTHDGWTLTDPCVLCEDVSRFGSGNMGPHAMDRCLATLGVRLDEEAEVMTSVSYQPPPPPPPPATPWRPPNTAPVTPQACNLDLDGILDTLHSARTGRRGHLIDLGEHQIRALVTVARDTLMRQPTLLELDSPINVLGDIHGQFHDLLRFFEIGGPPPASNYLLLGDYVDRGKQSMEVICLLLAYKVKYPENFFMLRGNHECASITRIYGFYDECKRRYNISLWKSFCDLFNCLPPVALIDSKILCMHGGLSPELKSFDCIRNLPRPTDVPDSGLLCDLLWNDPDKDCDDWSANDRGAGFTFGKAVLTRECARLGIQLVARAHQVVEDGYEFFGSRQLVTLFSAPNYCGEFNNSGAMMVVDEDLRCTFKLVGGADAVKDVAGLL